MCNATIDFVFVCVNMMKHDWMFFFFLSCLKTLLHTVEPPREPRRGGESWCVPSTAFDFVRAEQATQQEPHTHTVIQCIDARGRLMVDRLLYSRPCFLIPRSPRRPFTDEKVSCEFILNVFSLLLKVPACTVIYLILHKMATDA